MWSVDPTLSSFDVRGGDYQKFFFFSIVLVGDILCFVRSICTCNDCGSMNEAFFFRSFVSFKGVIFQEAH